MARPVLGRHTAHVEGPFVVFLIGLKLNRLWAIHKWWVPMVATMRVLRFLRKTPPQGYLGGELVAYGRGIAMIQYWRSFDELEAFARNADQPHLRAWRHLAKQALSDHTFGFWHETYRVEANAYECIYGNMPKFGLARFTEHVPLSDSETARKRMEKKR